MERIAVTLDDTLARALQAASAEMRQKPEALVLDALRRRLATLWVKDVQADFGTAARTAGYTSEEQILNELS